MKKLGENVCPSPSGAKAVVFGMSPKSKDLIVIPNVPVSPNATTIPAYITSISAMYEVVETVPCNPVCLAKPATLVNNASTPATVPTLVPASATVSVPTGISSCEAPAVPCDLTVPAVKAETNTAHPRKILNVFFIFIFSLS